MSLAAGNKVRRQTTVAPRLRNHHVTDAFAERGEVRATAECLHRQRGYEIVTAAVYRSSLVRVPSGLSPVLFESSDHAG